MLFDEELVQRAEEMRQKMSKRRKIQTNEVRKVRHFVKGNFTYVTVNDSFTGFAKFNPKDKKRWTEVSRNGKIRSRIQSKYNIDAGVNLALNRALEEYFKPLRE